MTFSSPGFLFVGVGLAALVTIAFVSRTRRGRRLVAFLGGRRAARRLAGRDLIRLQLERIVLLALAALAIGGAAAGPRGTPPEEGSASADAAPVRRVMVAIDVSSSMQETDISPTRLGSAVGIARALVESMDDAEIGLLLFAGKAYALTPPTRDHRGVHYLLRGVTPTTATPWDRESRLSSGIREGMAQLTVGDEAGREEMIVLISDAATSEPEEDAMAAARDAAASGIRVHTIGVGSRRSDVRDAVVFQEDVLRRIARAGNGTYTDGTAEPFVPARSPESFNASSPAGRAAPWNGADVVLWLTSAALVLLLVDGLLDGQVRLRKPEPAGSAR